MRRLAAVLVCAAPALAAADGLDEVRQARGRVEAALAAHGGADRLHDVASLTVRMKGDRFMIGQSRVYATVEKQPSSLVTTFDVAHDRWRQDSDQAFPGGYLLRYRTVLLAKDGYSLNLDESFDGPVIDRSPAADLPGARAQLARELPPLLLAHALERAATLRPVGDGVVFAEADGTQVELHFDAATHRLRSYETVGDHPLLGDVATDVEWSGQTTVAGLTLPTAFVERRNGAKAREGALSYDTAAPTDDGFAIPPHFVPAPTPPEPVRMLADGVGLIQDLPDGTQPLFVELSDSVVVIEAPSSSANSELAIARIAAATHGKPIRAVAFTHPHNDHANGLRAYMARGIPILSPPVWKPYLEALAAAPHTLRPDRLGAAPRAPVVETWTQRTVIGDKKRTVELVAIGPTAHCEATVVVWIPDAGVVYQGDMLIIPRVGDKVPPGAALTRALDRLIRERKWTVSTIAGTHGRVATLADLAAAVAQAPK